MITGINRRIDVPFGRESALEVFLEADPASALLSAFDDLLRRRGLELLYLAHDQAALAYLDIVPVGAALDTVSLPEGSDRESLARDEEIERNTP